MCPTTACTISSQFIDGVENAQLSNYFSLMIVTPAQSSAGGFLR